MSGLAVSTHTPVFRRPTIPTARCLHHMMRGRLLIRGDLVSATGLSQPTVTRAVTSLIGAGLIRERPDLVQATGPGRPRIPLEMAPSPWVHIGITTGIDSGTLLSFFDTRGRVLRETAVCAGQDPEDTTEHLIAGIHRLLSGMTFPLADIGVATESPEDGTLAERLTAEFGVPVTIGELTAALAAAELHTTETTADPILIIHLDHGLTVAVADDSGVRTHPVDYTLGAKALAHRLAAAGITTADGSLGYKGLLPSTSPQPQELRSLLDTRAHDLGKTVARLTRDTGSGTVVLAGPGFTIDPGGYRELAATVNPSVNKNVAIRIIPDTVTLSRAAARAVALDRLLSDPTAVRTTLASHAQR
ncbi:MarR family transcriptional regulator [Corynebacterium sp. CCM 9204]|uniref:MarR family transcriptional regulator n=1 Tax=Corynebacterium sp. CCM 9204 TaxID=3057616 RepID=UPI00352490B8